MAVRDGGKRTRFACLETARCMVAITVSAITVAVVVMVTIAALRPADSFSLSVVNGMDSSIPWLSKVNSSSSLDADAATNNTTMQRAAEKVNLTFALRAYNPSGRKDIRFSNFTVRVTDMPYFPSFAKMRDIAAFPVPAPFTLKRQGAHKLWSKFSLSDAGTLSYVAHTYGAQGTFKAMVLVNASIGSGSGSGTPASNNVTVTYYCWPVLVGWTAFADSPDGGVTCTPRKELSVDVDSLLPRSAPAPAAVYSRR
ncbi:hypothetical protein PAHAL_1G130000 [Panicum hallii]|uniref:Late embryogenesis abundant protein LEA-2 subgroup domain-containing protein n=1 Tax=Panicum hallii TaxID=206008 RepID=A0A2S3GNZ3_9POAL|nr:uncharacterized protein LOC112878247 [Panicum hallii]PAN05297.1 hypothetical protein PAHAL_1G130000 [Panicum hallii]